MEIQSDKLERTSLLINRKPNTGIKHTRISGIEVKMIKIDNKTFMPEINIEW